jgi:predicted amidophosphoribosyltransferase
MGKFWASLSSILFDESQTIHMPTRPFITQRFGIPIYSGSNSNSQILNLVLRAKEDNDLLARKFLAKLIIDGIGLKNRSEFEVVLIPSRREADRNRGIKHINELVNEVNKKVPFKTYDVLKHVKKVKDQATLSHTERLENLEGAFAIAPNKSVPTRAFLIDDLVTSGATIKAAATALHERNIELLGVIAACATMVFTE